MEKTRAVVIADAGPIIHLDELNSLDLLADFGKVIIPETVWNEVDRHRPQALSCFEVKLIRQRAVHFSAQVDALTPFYTLHAGEQEALHLCFEFTNSLLLTDDTAARLAAKNLGVAAHGTLGVLVRAIRQQTRSKSDVLELLRAISTRTTLHIRASLLAEVIRDVEKNAK
ncbi:DNA-binding protein [Methylobacter sp. G7]|uniref:DNA-binding protein n=1 Tax=Methylobacter sp. G7 TaxID=3230117 RepID=UPI003D802D76